jgi:hypothetical protein
LNSDIASDLGGIDHLSAAQQQLIRRCATIAVWCELQESLFIQQGKEIDMHVYATNSAIMRRHLEVLGIKRQPREIAMGLDEHIENRKPGRPPQPERPRPHNIDVDPQRRADRKAVTIDNDELSESNED